MKPDWTEIKTKLEVAWNDRTENEKKALKWSQHGMTEGRMLNRLRPKTEDEKSDFLKTLRALVESGEIREETRPHGRSGIPFKVYQNTYPEIVALERRKLFDIYNIKGGDEISLDVSQRDITFYLDVRDAVSSAVINGAEVAVSLNPNHKKITIFCPSRSK